MPKLVKGVMDEWKSGKLHSGSSRGPVVRNQKQAVAIALSEQRQKRQLPPVLQQRAQMVKEAHAHLSRAVPEYNAAPAAQRMMMTQHHVNLRMGKVK